MRNSSVGSLSCVTVIIGLAIGILIGALCWPYSINAWLEYTHKDPVLVWWQGALIGCVPGIGHLGLPVAVVTWIAMKFLA